MKSIKPGRGPSMMGGIGSIFAGIFGVIWTFTALQMGAPWFFALFGVFFIIMAVVQAVYNLKNATSKERYSSFDIVDSTEEEDPLNRRFGAKDDIDTYLSTQKSYCPYCGTSLDKEDYTFCPKCGKKLS